MKVFRPRSLDEAVRLMGAMGRNLTPLAGGTDLFVSWHHRVKEDLQLLDLSLLRDELGGYGIKNDVLEIGALTTYWDVMSSGDIAKAFPLLVAAAKQVGAIQIQTRGTWAGNIGNGSPAADGVPVMMAYDASVVLRSTAGLREIPLHSYWTGYKKTVKRPDELIVSMNMPIRARTVEWFHKVGARSAQTITKVGVAVVQDDRGWRVCANSVAPFVCRCRRLEAALDARREFLNPDEIRACLSEDISPIDDVRSTAAYRSNVLARLLFFGLSRDAQALSR
ncbi:MAG: FAD binding domain-containing protein [Planctomycetota bacterium]